MTTYIVFLLLGLANGAVFASLALALVVTFRSSGVINFAASSMALMTAYVYAFLRQGQLLDPIPGLPVTAQLNSGMGFLPAAALALVIAAAFGLVLYVLVFRPLRSAPPVARAIASIGIGLLLTGLLQERVGGNPVVVSAIFPRNTYTIGPVHFASDRVWFAVTVIAISVVLGCVYRFTTFGLRTRAAAETEKGAFVSGIQPDRIAAVNWMISSCVAGLAGILIAPIVPLVPSSYSLFIVPALAAAILGRFQGMAIAVAGGLVIGMLQSLVVYFKSIYSWMPSSGVPEMIPLALILLVLVSGAPNLPKRGEVVRMNLGRAPRPRSLLTTAVVSAAVALLALLLTHGQWRVAVVTSLIYAVIMLSQVVVTGFAGQVSLAQLVLAGCGAFLLSPLTQSWGVPFPLAPIVAALGATVIGVAVGLPAVRIRGLPLAVATLALAVAVEAFWFQNTDFVSSAGLAIKNPSLFGLDLAVGSGAAFPRLSFCIMVLVIVIMVSVGVAQLRRSRLGAAMLAVRANERSAAASGINVARTKLVAFAIASFIAGLGGALIAYQQGNVTYEPFDAIVGLTAFATVYLAGVTSVSGGLLAGVLGFGGVVYEFWYRVLGLNLSGWYSAIGGLGLVLTVVLNPEGMVGPFHAKIAERRERRAKAAAAPSAETEGAIAAGGVNAAVERVAEPAAEPPETLMSIADVHVQYGGVTAVDKVSLRIPQGRIIGLIGPNGAGKTTLIDAITGFAPSSGTVSLKGRSLTRLAPHHRARAGLGRTFQAMELWDDLTVSENIGVSLSRRSRARGSDIDQVLAVLGIAELGDRLVSELSHGQRQLVSIGRSLLSKPDLLLLDEPAAGLDSTESLWLRERLREVIRSGITILLVDHDMSLVLNVCDEIHVLNFGSVIASGPPEEIRSDPVVMKAYLGTMRSGAGARLGSAAEASTSIEQELSVE